MTPAAPLRLAPASPPSRSARRRRPRILSGLRACLTLDTKRTRPPAVPLPFGPGRDARRRRDVPPHPRRHVGRRGVTRILRCRHGHGFPLAGARSDDARAVADRPTGYAAEDAPSPVHARRFSPDLSRRFASIGRDCPRGIHSAQRQFGTPARHSVKDLERRRDAPERSQGVTVDAETRTPHVAKCTTTGQCGREAGPRTDHGRGDRPGDGQGDGGDESGRTADALPHRPPPATTPHRQTHRRTDREGRAEFIAS